MKFPTCKKNYEVETKMLKASTTEARKTSAVLVPGSIVSDVKRAINGLADSTLSQKSDAVY